MDAREGKHVEKVGVSFRRILLSFDYNLNETMAFILRKLMKTGSNLRLKLKKVLNSQAPQRPALLRMKYLLLISLFLFLIHLPKNVFKVYTGVNVNYCPLFKTQFYCFIYNLEFNIKPSSYPLYCTQVGGYDGGSNNWYHQSSPYYPEHKYVVDVSVKSLLVIFFNTICITRVFCSILGCKLPCTNASFKCSKCRYWLWKWPSTWFGWF